MGFSSHPQITLDLFKKTDREGAAYFVATIRADEAPFESLSLKDGLVFLMWPRNEKGDSDLLPQMIIKSMGNRRNFNRRDRDPEPESESNMQDEDSYPEE